MKKGQIISYVHAILTIALAVFFIYKGTEKFGPVKLREKNVLAGVLMLLPKSRMAGLLMLLPIITNIFLMHFFFDNRAGHADQTSASGQYRNVSAIYVHPSYNVSTNENDVALLYLSAPLSFNNDVMPVEYANMCNTTTADITPPTSALLSGWGLTCNSCGVSQFLNAVTMPLTTQTNAMSINTGYNPGFTANISANMLPFYNPGTGAAPGDSGGPAVIDKNGNKINLGASSWGYYPKDQLPT
ncbi:trypsin, partial [Ostertagia ostertagi]